MKITFWKIVLVSFIVFFLSWFLLYKTGVSSLPIQSEDTITSIFLPLSILKEKNIYLDSYYDMILEKYPHPDDKCYQKGLIPFYLRFTGEHYVSAFPIMSSVLALPFYIPIVLLNIKITWEILYILNHLSASFIVALSGGLFYILAKKHFISDTKNSVLLTLIYLFATLNFSLVSQSLWQHGTIQLFFILFLYFLYEKKYFWAFFMFGFAFLSRPTVLGVAPYMGYLLLFKLKTFNNFIKAFYKSLLGISIPILFFIWYNSVFYVSILNQGYSNQLFTNWLGRFPEGLLGLWLSPSKGLLVYSPVFIFSLLGFIQSLKNKKWRLKPDYIFYFMAVLSHTIFLGSWKHWYGGYSYGYRMASDIIPLLVLLLVPYLESSLYKRTKNLFMISTIISVLVQVSGLVFFDGIWHSAYDRGYTNTSWLWSIRDSELVFNIRRVLVKLNLLEQACPKCLPK